MLSAEQLVKLFRRKSIVLCPNGLIASTSRHNSNFDKDDRNFFFDIRSIRTLSTTL